MNGIFQKFTNIEIINIRYTTSSKQLIGRISSVFEKKLFLSTFCSKSMSFNLLLLLQPYLKTVLDDRLHVNVLFSDLHWMFTKMSQSHYHWYMFSHLTEYTLNIGFEYKVFIQLNAQILHRFRWRYGNSCYFHTFIPAAQEVFSIRSVSSIWRLNLFFFAIHGGICSTLFWSVDVAFFGRIYTQLKSSAYKNGTISSQELGKSFTFVRNNSGPRSDPCGTPYSTARAFEHWWLLATHWVQSLRYDLNHSKQIPLTLYLCNLSFKISGFFVSKAFLRSNTL